LTEAALTVPGIAPGDLGIEWRWRMEKEAWATRRR
jgi:hypothetical protein